MQLKEKRAMCTTSAGNITVFVTIHNQLQCLVCSGVGLCPCRPIWVNGEILEVRRNCRNDRSFERFFCTFLHLFASVRGFASSVREEQMNLNPYENGRINGRQQMFKCFRHSPALFVFFFLFSIVLSLSLSRSSSSGHCAPMNKLNRPLSLPPPSLT
jgi:hypothetical protein